MEWWLDVEGTLSSPWTGNATYNQDIVDGAHYYLADVLVFASGIYSNVSGWNAVTGGLNLSSVGLPEWVAANECWTSSGCAYNNGGSNWSTVDVWSPSTGWSGNENLDMTQWCSQFQSGNSIYTSGGGTQYGPFASEAPGDVKYVQGWYEKGGQSVTNFYYVPTGPFDGDTACY